MKSQNWCVKPQNLKLYISLEFKMTIDINVNYDSSFWTVRSQSILSSILKINVATLSASCLVFTHLEKLFRSTPLIQRLQPRFRALQLIAFPKTKITFQEEDISDRRWGSGEYDELMAIQRKDFEQWKRHWENCVRYQGAYFEEDWGVIFLHTMFLSFCTFLINVSIFHITWMDTFRTALVYIHGI